MRVFLPSIMAISLFFSVVGATQAAGNAAAGKLKAATCEACHGPASSHPAAPRLAGQPRDYTEQQLISFQNGTRTDPVMKGMAAALATEQDVKDVAAYYASLPYPEVSATKVSAKAKMGESLYLNKCAMCHGGRGAGSTGGGANTGEDISFMFGGGESQTPEDVPFIGGQPEAYLVKSLQDFRSGVRKSRSAFAMDMVSERMSDSQIVAVAKYLSSLSGGALPGQSLAKQD